MCAASAPVDDAGGSGGIGGQAGQIQGHPAAVLLRLVAVVVHLRLLILVHLCPALCMVLVQLECLWESITSFASCSVRCAGAQRKGWEGFLDLLDWTSAWRMTSTWLES